jgi:hypothetical protein
LVLLYEMFLGSTRRLTLGFQGGSFLYINYLSFIIVYFFPYLTMYTSLCRSVFQNL